MEVAVPTKFLSIDIGVSPLGGLLEGISKLQPAEQHPTLPLPNANHNPPPVEEQYFQDLETIDQYITFADDTLDDGDPNDDNTNDDRAGYCHSRVKGDIWHDYHAIPMPQSTPCKSLILMLLIHATLEFVTEDLQLMIDHIKAKDNADDWLTHFRFNREYWRARVRMLTPNSEDHAARIQIVRNFMAKNEQLQAYLTDNV